MCRFGFHFAHCILIRVALVIEEICEKDIESIICAIEKHCKSNQLESLLDGHKWRQNPMTTTVLTKEHTHVAMWQPVKWLYGYKLFLLMLSGNECEWCSVSHARSQSSYPSALAKRISAKFAFCFWR